MPIEKKYKGKKIWDTVEVSLKKLNLDNIGEDRKYANMLWKDIPKDIQKKIEEYMNMYSY